MAFNVTSWKRTGRDFGRGSPPPRGSFEWAAVGDMWTRSGLDVYELGYTELDAAKRWVETVDRSVKLSRAAHGKINVSDADARAWDALVKRWRTFYFDTTLLPGRPGAMLKSTKQEFDEIVSSSKRLYDRFLAAGMPIVPVPYSGELQQLLRGMPRRLTASEMRSRLLAGARCGEKMYDESTPWWSWAVAPAESRGLRDAVASARTLADNLARARDSRTTYSPGDPVYDELLRRLSQIWIEGSALYGQQEVRETARAQLADDVRKMPEAAGRKALWLAGLAGLAYLGISRMASPRPYQVVVGVPDAVPPDAEVERV
jgi:hypothetical protein